MHFHGNVHILCKLDENMHIFKNKFSEIGPSPSKVFLSKDNEKGTKRQEIFYHAFGEAAVAIVGKYFVVTKSSTSNTSASSCGQST